MFGFSRPCPRCGGSGTVVETAVHGVPGQGSVVRVKPVTVNIPAGATDGGKLRFKGKGEPGDDGGPAGDLYVVTHIKPHPYFTRDGADVVLDLPVTIAEAALGDRGHGAHARRRQGEAQGRRRAPQDGKVFRLPGKGAPEAQGQRPRRPEGQGEDRRAEGAQRRAEASCSKRFESSRDEDVRAHI